MTKVITLPLIGVGEASKSLELFPVQVRRLIERGELPAIKTALGYLVDRDDVEAIRAKREETLRSEK